MRVFGAESPPFQPPQGRSGKFRIHFSPVTTGAAGQSSGARSPEAAQAHVAAEQPLDDPERMLHPRPHPSLRQSRRAARCLPGFMAMCHEISRCACSARYRSRDIRRQSGPASSRRAEAGLKASGRDAGGRSLRMVHQQLPPARCRTLSASQIGLPSPGRSGCRTAERSARATSPATDVPVQCDPPIAPRGSVRPSVPERSRGAS